MWLMPSYRIKVTGGETLKRVLQASGSAGRLRAQQAMYRGASRIFAESQRQTPHKTGVLRGSGTVVPLSNGAKIAYGTGYAVYVHEILTNHHPIGNAKFLERPMSSMGPGVLRDVAKAALPTS